MKLQLLLLFLTILSSQHLYADDQLIVEKTVKEISPIIQNISNIGKPAAIACNNQIQAEEFLECTEATKLSKYIQKNFKEVRQTLDGKLFNLYETCFQKHFNQCYPNLKEEISLDKLESLFENWKKDPRFRYGAGVGMCAYRAESLSYQLAELGFKTKTIRIENSPSLIAMDFDKEGNLNGNYDEYQGYHTIVQIMVNSNGNQVPYILDPQYMDKPMPLEKYFIKTTGQICKKTTGELEAGPTDLTSCYYHEEAQNIASDSGAMRMRDNPRKSEGDKQMLNCGWSGEDVKVGHSIAPKWENIKKNNLKIVCTNCVGDISAFEGKEVTSSTRNDLIIYAYEHFADNLRKKLVAVEDQIKFEATLPPSTSTSVDMAVLEKLSSENNLKLKENYIYSLTLIDAKIKIVRENLKNQK